MYNRITLNVADFQALVRGREVTVEGSRINNENRIILQDIGFDNMIRFIEDAQREANKVNVHEGELND